MASDPESFPKSNGVTEPKDSFLVRSLKDYILIIPGAYTQLYYFRNQYRIRPLF